MSRAVTLLVAGTPDPDDAIDLLEGVCWGFLKNPKGTRFEVPEADPGRLLGELGDRFPLWPLGVRVRQGAIGPFGVPAIRSMRRTDLVLLVGSLPGRPAASLALAALAAKRLSRPLVAYGIDVGDGEGGALRRWLLGRCDAVVARDLRSEASALRGGACAILGRAEPAFHLRGAAARAVAPMLSRPAGQRIGLELEALEKRGFETAAARALAAATGVEPLFLARGAGRGTLRRAECRAETWTGILGALDLFVGERPAWLLRAVSMGVPVLALGGGGSAAGVLDDLGLSAFREDGAPERIVARASEVWREREDVARRVRAAGALARDAAREAAARVSRTWLRPPA